MAEVYNPWLSVKKGLAGAATAIVAILPMLLDPLIVYFSTDANVSTAIQQIDPSRAAWAPIIAFLIRTLANARKQTKA